MFLRNLLIILSVALFLSSPASMSQNEASTSENAPSSTSNDIIVNVKPNVPKPIDQVKGGESAVAVDVKKADGSPIEEGEWNTPERIGENTFLYQYCPDTCNQGHCCWNYIGGQWICHHDYCPSH